VQDDIDPVKFINYYRTHWVEYIEDICGLKTWSAMRLIAESVQNNQRTSVRACHGISKTLTAAALSVTFLNLYFPSVVITTAPTGNQVKNLLWKEIGEIYARNGSFLNGKADMQQIRIEPDWYMLGFSTDRPDRMEGFHSPNIFWILDEAKGLEKWIYDAVEGSLTGGQARVIELSTTDGADQQCPFRQHQSEELDSWNCVKLSSYDSPFVNPAHFPEAKKYMNKDLYKYGKPLKGREWPKELEEKIQIADEATIIDKKKMWIVKRPDLWETKILGEFSTSGENNIIPLSWVQSAVEAEVDDSDTETCYGLDVARMGTDKTVLTPRVGKTVQKQEIWGKKNTMETCGIVRSLVEDYELVKVDACGLGAGVFDRLAELLQPTIGLESAAAAFDDKKFANLKAEMWWCAREKFEEQYENGNTLSIPNDPELIEDLTGMKYNIKSNGKIIVEDKKDFKKRMGRSPDQGDSCVYNLYEPPLVEEEYYGEPDDDTDIFI
jgi:phage terminase large subunit